MRVGIARTPRIRVVMARQLSASLINERRRELAAMVSGRPRSASWQALRPSIETDTSPTPTASSVVTHAAS